MKFGERHFKEAAKLWLFFIEKHGLFGIGGELSDFGIV
jgi:hypothetical protein